jgi:hypothetical protein
MKFISEFVEYAREFTACPTPFLEWSAILCLSSVAGRSHILRRGNWDVHPNLWILILGKSSSYKSTGLATGRRLLREALPACLMGQEYSSEKLLDDLAENPHRLFTYDEAETFFKMLQQKYNPTLKSALMTLWRDDWYTRKTKKGEVVIRDAYLCWGGATTPVQIANVMEGNESDLLSGMLPRFCLIPYFGPESSIANPPPDNPAKRAALVARLSILAAQSGREYVYAPNALKAIESWQDRLGKRLGDYDPLLGAFFRKMRDEHFHKLAILSAFERGSGTIELSDIEFVIPKLYEIEKNLPIALIHLTDTRAGRLRERIKDFLSARVMVTRTELFRRFPQPGGKVIDSILNDLESGGVIDVRMAPGKTKPTKEIHYVG